MVEIRIPQFNTSIRPVVFISDEQKIGEAILSATEYDASDKAAEIEKLINAEPRLLNCNLGNQYGNYSPLALAAGAMKFPIILKLLELGADPLFSTPLGLPPIASAFSERRLENTDDELEKVITTLLTFALKISNETLAKMIAYRTHTGASILCALAEDGLVKSAITILKTSSDFINLMDDKDRTPLNLSIIFKHETMAHVLLNYGADVNIPDEHNELPLHRVSQYDSSDDLFERILKNTTNVSLTNENQRSCLIIHCNNTPQKLNRIRLLLDRNPDTSIIDTNNMAAISYVVTGGSIELLRLFRGREKPDDKLIVPPLFHLVLSTHLDENEFREMIKELLLQGYSVNGHDYSVSATFSGNSETVSRCEILQELTGISFSAASGVDNNYQIKLNSTSFEDSENKIEWTMYNDAAKKTETINKNLKTESKLTNILKYFLKNLTDDEGSNDFKSLTIAFLYLIKNHLTDEEIISFGENKSINFKTAIELIRNRCLISAVFVKDYTFLKSCEFLFDLIFKNKQKFLWIDNINDSLKVWKSRYIYNFLKSEPGNQHYLITGHLDDYCELFDFLLKNIYSFNEIIGAICYSSKVGNLKSSDLKKILKSFKKILKKSQESDIKNELYELKMIYIIKNYLALSNEYFLALKKENKNDLAIEVANDFLNYLKNAQDFLEKLGEDYVDYFKTKLILDELEFEYHLQLSILFDTFDNKREQQLEHAEKAIELVRKKEKPWPSENDLRFKKEKLKNLRKNARRALKKPVEIESSIEPNKSAPTPTNPENKRTHNSQDENINTRLSNLRIEEEREYEKREKAEKNRLLELRKEAKKEKQKESSSTLEVKKVSTILVLKWTEAQVREIYKDILTPHDELVLLRNPANPKDTHGTHWACLRLVAEDYSSPEEYEQDLKAFRVKNEDGTSNGEISYNKDDVGVIYHNNTYYIRSHKMSRPHGTCYQTAGGDPYLIIFDTLLSHPKHNIALRNAIGKPPKPILVTAKTPT